MKFKYNGLFFAAAAMLSIFLHVTPALADSANQQLRGWLKENKISSRLVKLDRQDGFSFGLRLQGDGMPAVTISPNRNRSWLLQVEGEEMLLQQDSAGSLRIIAQSDDWLIWICYFKQLTEFLTSILSCTQLVPLCYADNFLGFLIGLQGCVPEEPSYKISG